MPLHHRIKNLLALALLIAATSASGATQVVMLGTGTPIPTPDRSGPATAIVVDGKAYLVDFGPGVVRRAAAASTEYGGTIEGLAVDRLEIAFLTHLHHDHSAGLPDLVYTSWTHGREAPFELYGPAGIRAMAEHVAAAWEEDNRYRLYGLEPAAPEGWKINAHEINEGVVYQDERVTVEAFKVKHGTWPNAFGYRFTTPDKVIVISGDAAYDPTIERMAMNHYWCGDRTQDTVWESKKDKASEYNHPTQKPIELALRAIKNSSKEGNLIFDPFVGSGTSLLACEQTGRICYGMELDPGYVDVIVKRWENYTGEKAKKL